MPDRTQVVTRDTNLVRREVTALAYRITAKWGAGAKMPVTQHTVRGDTPSAAIVAREAKIEELMGREAELVDFIAEPVEK